jgi:hypothetical protein
LKKRAFHNRPLREQAVAPLSAYPGISEVCFAPMNGHRETPLPSPKSAIALNRCAIARGGGRGAHRYGSTRGEMVSSVWVILS